MLCRRASKVMDRKRYHDPGIDCGVLLLLVHNEAVAAHVALLVNIVGFLVGVAQFRKRLALGRLGELDHFVDGRHIANIRLRCIQEYFKCGCRSVGARSSEHRLQRKNGYSFAQLIGL